jgi:murein DD-endopeptidase MepM/ murein hydrolase activator NlpD
VAHGVAALLVLAAALVGGIGMAPPSTARAPAAETPGADLAADPLVLVAYAPAGGVRADEALALRPLRALAAPAYAATHTLAEGETLGAVAARYGVTPETLFWANGLERSGFLAAGDDLRVPRVSGVPHTVQEGETVESIARLYGVPPAALTLFEANGLGAGREPRPGAEIFVPGGRRALPETIAPGAEGLAGMRAVVAASVREDETNLRGGPGRAYDRLGELAAGERLRPTARHGDWVRVEAGALGEGWVRADLIWLPPGALENLPETNDFPPPPPRWVWPTWGEISSRFGGRRVPFRSFHNGLDIANRAGTPILAARAGRVVEAGWCSGYGYCVKIDHGEGVQTIYGHMLRKPPVRRGDAVAPGDRIGSMGSTFDRAGGGYSTGVHLHFTVLINGRAVDPLRFLP